MKIIWINDHATFAGGAETYVYQTAKDLAERYHVENILLYSTDSRIDPSYADVFTFTTVIADLKEQLKLLKPDLVYVHQVADNALLQTLSELDIPVVGFIHDHKHFCPREHKYTTLGHETCTKAIGLGCYSCLGVINKKPSFPYIGINTVSNVRAIQNLLKEFKHIIVASDYMKEHLKLHGFNEQQISKIALFSLPEEEIVQIDSPSDEKRFLFVGQLVRGKGVDTLLNAFASMRDNNSFLDICGDGKQRAELEQQSKDLGIAGRVKFHGKVTAQELGRYYTNAYAVIIPSRAPETFNLVGVEAMKYGKAVIASNVGGIQEWLKDRDNGFNFPSNDTKKLTSILNLTISNPKMIKKMGEAGRQSYEEKFIPEIHSSKLYNLFESLITKDNHAL
jgi:glycosyltransferase involved in cell wall biosynthesis